VAPHLPRLDWMMWFAAQGAFEEERWFQSLCDRLFEGSPDVRALLAVDPFPASPPQFIRATRTIYRFTRPGQGSAWWVRVPVGPYSPVLTRGERERLAWRSRRQPRRLAPAAISPRLHVRSVPGSDDNGVVVREVTKAWS
jgi:hypothetical protein